MNRYITVKKRGNIHQAFSAVRKQVPSLSLRQVHQLITHGGGIYLNEDQLVDAAAAMENCGYEVSL